MTIQHINHRAYTLPDHRSETLEPETNYLFDLEYLSVIELLGDKSAEFLQGQISCDVTKVTNDHMEHGVMCNLKGRILTLLDVINWNGIKLILPQDIQEKTLLSLSKTALFSKVSVKSYNKAKVFGYYQQDNLYPLPSANTLPSKAFAAFQFDLGYGYALGNGRYILLINENHVDKLTSSFKPNHQLLGSLAWHRLQLQHGDIEIYPETRGEFLPHRLGLQHKGYLDFNKGCYKGQEIIARTHYRAKLKHELQLFQIQTTSPITSGQKLLSKVGGVELGEIIDFCPTGEDGYLVAASVLKDFPSQCFIGNQEQSTEFLST